MKILLDLPGEGKIIEGPGPIAPGLECIAVPHGLQIASTEPDFHDGGRIIPVDLMTPLEPCLSLWDRRDPKNGAIRLKGKL